MLSLTIIIHVMNAGLTECQNVVKFYFISVLKCACESLCHCMMALTDEQTVSCLDKFNHLLPELFFS